MGKMNAKEVKQKIGKENWEEFLIFMKGQTIGYDNGIEDYYEHDVLRFIFIQNAPKKLKTKDIPIIKEELLIKQNDICPICKRDLILHIKKKDRCLDHSHITGRVRAVLCRSCNAIEGKAYKNFVRYGLRKAGIDYQEFMVNLTKYINYPETNYIHPKHKEKKK